MFIANQLIGLRGAERSAMLAKLFGEEMRRGLTEMEVLNGDGVTIFGTARRRKGHPDYEQAYRLGYGVAKAGMIVIEGGGPGAMEGAAEGAVAAGGKAVSVCLKLPHEEKPNPFGSLNLQHQFFPTRKAMFIEHSTAFILVKGGFGTCDELFEVLCSVQCRMSTKVPIYLVGTKFWNPLDNFIRESLLSEGMISAGDEKLYTITDDEDEVIEGVVSHWKTTRVVA